MDTIIYIVLFVIGTLFGSFYSLAIHRIPKKQDILKTNSYCPNCNKKLGFLELIPVFSYIFLKGKCKSCGKKINLRYVLLEITFGLIFLIVGFLMNLNMENINNIRIIEYCFIVLYLTYLALIIGIDKLEHKIQKSVNIYGIIISIIYMVYLYIVDANNIYRYAIYLLTYIIILTLDTITLRKFAKNSYGMGILIMITTMTVFTGEYVVINTIISSAIAIAIYIVLTNLKTITKRNIKRDLKIYKKIDIGFYLGTINILVFIATLIYIYVTNIRI